MRSKKPRSAWYNRGMKEVGKEVNRNTGDIPQEVGKMSDSFELAMREVLADVFREQSQWRTRLVERYPGDPRNIKAAQWLEAAALWVESGPSALTPYVDSFEDLAAQVDDWPVVASLLERDSSGRNCPHLVADAAVGRFGLDCFDKLLPGNEDFSSLMATVSESLWASLRDAVIQTVRDGNQLPASLREYLEIEPSEIEWDESALVEVEV